jgi:hypothetical protein
MIPLVYFIPALVGGILITVLIIRKSLLCFLENDPQIKKQQQMNPLLTI